MNYTALIGNPVNHSISNYLFAKFAEKANLEYAHLKIKIASTEGLLTAFNSLRNLGFKGFNITLPYKVDCIELLDFKDDSVVNVGAVNTVKIVDGKYYGYNTDSFGAISTINYKLKPITKNEGVIIFGAGGASRATIAEVRKYTSNITVVNRTMERAEKIREEFKLTPPSIALSDKKKIYDCIQNNDIKYFINCTSVGMANDQQSIMDIDRIDLKGKFFMDAVFNPMRTKFLVEAENKGAHIASGLYRMVYQGVKAFNIWNNTNLSFDDTEIENIVNFLKIEILNMQQDNLTQGANFLKEVKKCKQYSDRQELFNSINKRHKFIINFLTGEVVSYNQNIDTLIRYFHRLEIQTFNKKRISIIIMTAIPESLSYIIKLFKIDEIIKLNRPKISFLMDKPLTLLKNFFKFIFSSFSKDIYSIYYFNNEWVTMCILNRDVDLFIDYTKALLDKLPEIEFNSINNKFYFQFIKKISWDDYNNLLFTIDLVDKKKLTQLMKIIEESSINIFSFAEDLVIQKVTLNDKMINIMIFVLKKGLYPTDQIMQLYKQYGESLHYYLTEKGNEKIKKDIQYMAFRSHNDLACTRHINYIEYLELITKQPDGNESEYDNAYFLQAGLEAIFANYTIKHILHFRGKEPIVISNLSYGKIISKPMENELSSLKIPLYYVHMGSNDGHRVSNYINQHLFPVSLVKQLLTQNRDLIVLDGTPNPSFTDSNIGFKTYFFIVNYLVYKLSGNSDYINYFDSHFIEDVLNNDYFKFAVNYFQNIIISNNIDISKIKPYRMMFVSCNDNMYLHTRGFDPKEFTIYGCDLGNNLSDEYNYIFFLDPVERKPRYLNYEKLKQGYFDDKEEISTLSISFSKGKLSPGSGLFFDKLVEAYNLLKKSNLEVDLYYYME